MGRFGQDRRTWSRPRGKRTPSFSQDEQAESRLPPWANTGGSWRDRDTRNSGPDRNSDQAGDEELTGSFLHALPLDVLSPDNDSESSPRITNCEFVASYNWIDGEQPTIMIPGGPPTWNRPSDSPKVPKDEGDYFRDINSARWPKHAIEPAIRAVFELNENFDTKNIDIVTTSATIECLFEYIDSKTEPFKIEVERVGNTVFMLSRQSSPKALVENVWGCGHNFLNHYTKWDPSVKGSLSHQRVLRYDFCGLRFLARFECDGYLEDQAHIKTEHLPDQSTSQQQAGNNTETPTEATNPAAITEGRAEDSDELSIRRGGFSVPQESTFDVKTRAVGADMPSTIKQRLWARQIPTLIAAWHRKRKFNEIEFQKLDDEFEAWESDNGEKLARLGNLFRQIISITERPEARKLCVFLKKRYLEIREQAGSPRSMLPPNLEARWTGNDSLS